MLEEFVLMTGALSQKEIPHLMVEVHELEK